MQENLSAPQSNLALPKEPKKKFPILDVVIILSAVFVVTFLAYLVVNPSKENSDVRNVHRSADVSSILTSVSGYIDVHGEIPEQIPLSNECVDHGNEICKSGPYNCKDLVDLSFLDTSDGEIFSTPIDPQNRSINGTGYYIHHNGEGLITVCAPYAERNVEVSFSKYIY